jgi:hypothetical protein
LAKSSSFYFFNNDEYRQTVVDFVGRVIHGKSYDLRTPPKKPGFSSNLLATTKYFRKNPGF